MSDLTVDELIEQLEDEAKSSNHHSGRMKAIRLMLSTLKEARAREKKKKWRFWK